WSTGWWTSWEAWSAASPRHAGWAACRPAPRSANGAAAAASLDRFQPLRQRCWNTRCGLWPRSTRRASGGCARSSAGAVAERRVDRAEVAARPAFEEPGADEAAGCGDPLPARKRDRVRHPEVAAICVVLDQHQTPPGLEVAVDELEHGVLPADEVQGVRHHDPLEPA